MTRTELTKAGFVEDDFAGHIISPTSEPFRQHESFDCGGFFMVDVDFAPSDSKYVQPTDIIIKVSEPYFDKTYGVRN